MVIPVPSPTYLESLCQSIREEGLVHDRLYQLLFAVIDEFCARLPVRAGPGRRKTYSENTILKLDMLMHLTGNPSTRLRTARPKSCGKRNAIIGTTSRSYRANRACGIGFTWRWPSSSTSVVRSASVWALSMKTQ
jgi:hypothetical protein